MFTGQHFPNLDRSPQVLLHGAVTTPLAGTWTFPLRRETKLVERQLPNTDRVRRVTETVRVVVDEDRGAPCETAFVVQGFFQNQRGTRKYTLIRATVRENGFPHQLRVHAVEFARRGGLGDEVGGVVGDNLYLPESLAGEDEKLFGAGRMLIDHIELRFFDPTTGNDTKVSRAAAAEEFDNFVAARVPRAERLNETLEDPLLPQERRYASDGKAYTKDEFKEFYRGYKEWDRAKPARRQL